MVYLIHFDTKYKHAQHYLGYTDNGLENRIQEHRKGKGARLMQVITKAEISWSVVRTWEGNRKLERKLKNRKNSSRLCPECKQIKELNKK